MKILEKGIYLVVFCLPLYLVRLKVFNIPTTVLEILIYLLFLFWLFQGGYKNLGEALKNRKLLILGIIFLLVGVSLATIFSADLINSAGIWKAWFIDPFLFFLVLVTTIRPGQIRKVLFSLFLSGAIVAGISLIYLFLGKLDPFGRLEAFYDSPNYLAMYLAPALIIGFFIFFSKKQFFVFLAIVALLAALFFTKSFGAWMGLIIAFGFGLFAYFYKEKKPPLKGASLAQKGGKKTFFLLFCVFLAAILVFCLLVINQRESSFDARIIIWQKSFEIFKNNPILGIGPGTFENYFPPYPEWGVPQPHNLYLAFLLQTGLVGFIGLILILFWFFSREARSRTTGQLSIIMIYILAHGLVDTTYWKNDLAVAFWLVIGLMVIIKKEP